MKTQKSGIVKKLKEKHKKRLALAQRKLKWQMANPRMCDDRCLYESDIKMFYKWAYRVGKGWNGFLLGNVPPVWTDVLDEFLCWLEIQCPEFEIHQIKLKLGSLRFYVGTKTDLIIPDKKIRSEIDQLRNLMRLPNFPQPPIHKARKKRQKLFHRP